MSTLLDVSFDGLIKDIRKRQQHAEASEINPTKIEIVPSISFPDYNDYDISQIGEMIPTLELTDKENLVLDALVFQNPALPYNGIIRNSLEGVSVWDVKQILSRADDKDPLRELRLEARVAKILTKSLKAYNELVLRNCLEADSEGIGTNLFLRHQDKKRAMIEYQLKSIVEYLLEGKKEFIFGILSDKDRVTMYNAARATMVCKNKDVLRRNLINAFTYEEVSTGIFIPGEDVMTLIDTKRKRELKPPIARIFR